MTLDHSTAMTLQATELARATALLARLRPEQWSAQTDCPAWDVRRMYLHVVGACEAGASVRETMRQMRAAKAVQRREGGPMEAALSSVQVREREHLDTSQLVQRLTDVAPRAVAGRRRMPGLMRRHVSLKVDGPVVERWRLGYLVDTIYLRDMWMHRVDACRATGEALELTPEHDGVIVADVVEEWARRHGQPFVLELIGPAGGRWEMAGEGPHLTLDAVEFCRMVGGRGQGDGLLATVVPF